jgi:Zn-dependent protease with chaperone function
MGMGDLAYLASIVLTNIIYLILFVLKNRIKGFYLDNIIIISIAFLIVFFALSLTFLRGPEYAWNGSILVR